MNKTNRILLGLLITSFIAIIIGSSLKILHLSGSELILGIGIALSFISVFGFFLNNLQKIKSFLK